MSQNILNKEICSEYKMTFLKKFIENPLEIGSICPSSRFLTSQIIAPIKWSKASFIIELGAGTGVFTQAIYDLKDSNCHVLIFEKDPEMRQWLQQNFYDASIGIDALQLENELAKISEDKADYIISGLPFAVLDPGERKNILSQVVKSLNPHGKFIAFQYSLQMFYQLKKIFTKVTIKFVPLNIPPAFVYICEL